MSHPAQLRMILADHDVRKLQLPSGIPKTTNDLQLVIRDTFGIVGDFSLHHQDVDFGNEFFTLLSTTDIKDRDTIKVVYILEPPTISLTLTDVTNDCVRPLEQSPEDTFSVSSNDTLLLSSAEDSPGHRSQRWPSRFHIPRFAYNTEIQVQLANERFNKDGTLFSGHSPTTSRHSRKTS